MFSRSRMKNKGKPKTDFQKKKMTRIFFKSRTKRRMIFLNFSQKQNEFF